MEAQLSPAQTPAARWSAPPTRRSVTVGDITVTYLPDGYVQLHPDIWFSLPGDHNVYSGREELIGDDGFLTGSIGSLLVSGRDWSLMIDAGFGPRHLPGARSHPSLGDMHGGRMADEKGLPTHLTAAVFTHLHDDHTGWLRADGGVARLLSGTTLTASETELRLSPLSTSGNWQAAGNGSEVVPGVTAISTPGHTLGHMSYMVESQGQRLLCFGDVMHSPIQVSRPTLNSCFEADPSASLLSRERTLEDLTDTGVIGVGMHFGDVVFGHVATLHGERTWLPIH